MLRRIAALLAQVKLTLQAADKGIKEAHKDRLDKRLFGTKVVIDRGQIDPGLTGNQTQRRFGKAFFRKQLLGSIQNALDGIRLRHASLPG